MSNHRMNISKTMGLCNKLQTQKINKTPNTKQIMVDLPAQLPKTQVRLSTLDLSQGGRFEVGSGKHHKNGPRGRFGLTFGANPILRV